MQQNWIGYEEELIQRGTNFSKFWDSTKSVR